MVSEISTVTDLAGTATKRHRNGAWRGGSLQGAVAVMAGGAGIMHLAVGWINRDAGRRADNTCRQVAAIAVSGINNLGQMV